MDVLEFRLVAAAHVVDDEVAALEADLGKVAAVEAQRPQAVEPGEEAREALLQACACRRHGSPLREAGGAGVAGVDGPTAASDTVVASGRRAAPVDTDTRPSASTRIASSAPTRLRRSARGVPLNRLALDSPTSAFGALRDQRPVAVANLDVADADGGAAVLVALQHRAADLDLKLVADVLGDRLRKPWRDDVERNRAGGQAPIQPSADQEDHGERAGRDERRRGAPRASGDRKSGAEPSARGAAVDAKQLLAASHRPSRQGTVGRPRGERHFRTPLSRGGLLLPPSPDGILGVALAGRMLG